MPQTKINCPSCRQPIAADVQQLFDVGQDPQAKEKLLSGLVNVALCPHCNYQGDLATPVVYHDPEKELLLTFFPPDMGLPMEEQERILGPMITKVFDNLPQEQRKGYLLSPRSAFTLKGLLERILEGDGITKEMLDAQEARMKLIQELMTVSEDTCIETIKKEETLIDDEFFSLFGRLIESAVYNGDKNTSKKLQDLQLLLIKHSLTGKRLQTESEEIQKARQALEELGEQLTRDKLLDLILTASNENVLRAYVQMTRSGMDYEFFKLLSARIDALEGVQKESLETLREHLLTYTQELDALYNERIKIARQNVEALTQVEDIKAAIMQNLGAIDQFFIQALTDALDAAREANDLELSAKLQQAMNVIEEISSAPSEYAIIDELLLLADDEKALIDILKEQSQQDIKNLIELLTNLVSKIQTDVEQDADDAKPEEQEMIARLQIIYGAALKVSMESAMEK